MITLLHVSDGQKHFKEAISEYTSRTTKYLEIIQIKPIKHTDIRYIKQEETKKIIETLKKRSGKVILCDERGSDLDTRGFADWIESHKNQSEHLIYIIGGSYGVDIDMLRAHTPIQLLRLSHLVMPHGLALLVLIEQIYRAHEIMRGSGYHHM